MRVGAEVITPHGIGRVNTLYRNMAQVSYPNQLNKSVDVKQIIERDNAIFVMEKGITDWDKMSLQERTTMINGMDNPPEGLRGSVGYTWQSLNDYKRNVIMSQNGLLFKAGGEGELNGKKGDWITMRGRKVFIPKGENVGDVIKKEVSKLRGKDGDSGGGKGGDKGGKQKPSGSDSDDTVKSVKVFKEDFERINGYQRSLMSELRRARGADMEKVGSILDDYSREISDVWDKARSITGLSVADDIENMRVEVDSAVEALDNDDEDDKEGAVENIMDGLDVTISQVKDEVDGYLEGRGDDGDKTSGGGDKGGSDKPKSGGNSKEHKSDLEALEAHISTTEFGSYDSAIEGAKEYAKDNLDTELSDKEIDDVVSGVIRQNERDMEDEAYTSMKNDAVEAYKEGKTTEYELMQVMEDTFEQGRLSLPEDSEVDIKEIANEVIREQERKKTISGLKDIGEGKGKSSDGLKSAIDKVASSHAKKKQNNVNSGNFNFTARNAKRVKERSEKIVADNKDSMARGKGGHLGRNEGESRMDYLKRVAEYSLAEQNLGSMGKDDNVHDRLVGAAHHILGEVLTPETIMEATSGGSFDINAEHEKELEDFGSDKDDVARLKRLLDKKEESGKRMTNKRWDEEFSKLPYSVKIKLHSGGMNRLLNSGRGKQNKALPLLGAAVGAVARGAASTVGRAAIGSMGGDDSEEDEKSLKSVKSQLKAMGRKDGEKDSWKKLTDKDIPKHYITDKAYDQIHKSLEKSLKKSMSPMEMMQEKDNTGMITIAVDKDGKVISSKSLIKDEEMVKGFVKMGFDSHKEINHVSMMPA